MSAFIEIGWRGEHIPVGEIIEIGLPNKNSHGVDERAVTMRDGTTHRIGPYDLARIIMRPVQMIPAEPGTFHVRAWRDGPEAGLNKSPVIGWALCADGDVRPVTPQGVFDLGDRDTEIYVLMPDGTVQAIGEHTEPVWFDTLDDYVRHATPPLREPVFTQQEQQA